jgi:predicted small metal-binding protein
MCKITGTKACKARILLYKIFLILLYLAPYNILRISKMYKLECREVGFDCSHTMTGNTQEEVLEKAKEHGTREHNLKESEIQSPDMQTKLRSLMHRTD